MKVAIFETTHFEGAYPLIKLFDNGANDITIFTYEGSYRQFQFLFGKELNKYTWIVKKESESKYRFIHQMFKQVQSSQVDLFYLNTISDNYILYAWLISKLKLVRVITTLHSINNYFQHKPAFSLRRMVRIMGKKKLIHTVREFNVVSLTMVDYLKQRIPSSKKVHCLPGAVFEPEKHLVMPPLQAILKVVVPGAIDERRRNYRMIIDLVPQLEQAGLNVCITLLGGIDKTHGQNILDILREKDWSGKLIYYSADVVDQPEFDRVMEESHVVLLPSTIYTNIFDNITEEYGLSTSSGNLFDIIKHAKPFIAPAALRVDPFLEASCVRYNEPIEIVRALKTLAESPQLLSAMMQQARSASGNYSIEVVRKRNPSLFF